MYDLLVKNGNIVDGTGRPAYRADVGVSAGIIVDVGELNTAGKQVIDADGLIVSPGFIDPHTHYDAQICWDTLLTPSSWHGVTSVVLGNCGVGIAPCHSDAREVAMRDLENVEAIPFEVLEKGITWDWESFPEFMDFAQRQKIGVNTAFLAPLSPFRHFVMGQESIERAADEVEMCEIARLLGEALDHGAFGFSSTILNQHMGFGGKPLACRNANREELKLYANTLKKRNKGAIEIALTRQLGVLEEDQCDLLDMLLDESGRPVTFIAMFDRDDISEAVRESLRRAKPMIEKGARPQTSPLPITREMGMRNPFSFASFPSWKRVFENKSKEAQKLIYSDQEFRKQFREDLKNPTGFADWQRITLHQARNEVLAPFIDLSVSDIAHAQGKDPVDTFLDIAVADDLACEFTIQSFNTRIDRVAELLNDPSILIGLGDGGAHVDMLCDSGYPTYLLGTWVRDRGVLSLEEGVRRLTSDPADFFGIKDRGRLRRGYAADITIFDAAEIGSSDRPERRYDLPGGAKRMVMPSRGIKYTIVNGILAWKDGFEQSANNGMLLKS
ncbi:MAG: amidohydrolase family protein [Proteobacteria bacterium]|nr:amidohydrolase family protein [Pseudomonadota bacterium]